MESVPGRRAHVLGVMGANLAAVLRGIVGIVWYGVQTYFASKAVQALAITLYPAAADYTHNDIFGLSTLGWISFLFMWIFQLLIFLRGIDQFANSSISAGLSSMW